MNKNFVLTLSGPDRIGIVENLTRLLVDHGGNVEMSRMARLGGEFAVLMLVSMPAERFAGLEKDSARLAAQGYKVTISPTEQAPAESYTGWLPYQIEVYGADHEGIIHEIARYLSGHGINIESMDTGTTPAPVSGAPLFTMTAAVLVPPALSGRNWRAELEEIGDRLNVDIRVSGVRPR